VATVNAAAAINPTSATKAISVVATATIQAAPIKPATVIALIPGACANEYTAYEVAGSVISVGCASIWVIGIVPIRADRSRAVIGISVVGVAGIIVAIIGIPVISIAVIRVSVIVVVVVSVIIVITVVIAVVVTVIRVPVVRVAVAIVTGAHANPNRDLCRCGRRHKGQNPQRPYIFQVRHNFSYPAKEDVINDGWKTPG
jgi:hypothetical protein